MEDETINVTELDLTKRKITSLEEEIEEVKARVKELEKKKDRDDEEKEELKQKRQKENLLLANLSDLRKEKARLEKQLEEQRSGQVPEEWKDRLEFFRTHDFHSNWFVALRTAYDNVKRTKTEHNDRKLKSSSSVPSSQAVQSIGMTTRSKGGAGKSKNAKEEKEKEDTSASSASPSDTQQDNISGSVVMNPIVFLCAQNLDFHDENEVLKEVMLAKDFDFELKDKISSFKDENDWTKQFYGLLKTSLGTVVGEGRIIAGCDKKKEINEQYVDVNMNSLKCEFDKSIENCKDNVVCMSCQMLSQKETQSDLQVMFGKEGNRVADVIFEVGLVNPGWKGGRKKVDQGSKNVKHWFASGCGAMGVPVFSIELYVVKKKKEQTKQQGTAHRKKGRTKKMDEKSSHVIRCDGEIIGVAVTAFLKNKEDKKQHRLELCFEKFMGENNSAESILMKVFEACMSQGWSEWERLGKNVTKFGDTILKSFAQRDHQTLHESEKRSPFLSHLLIEGAKLDSQSAILTYPVIKGTCGDFSSKKAILSFLEAIQQLHKKGVIMGDIRRRNWITYEDKMTGKLIDFDYSGCTEEWKEAIPAPDYIKDRCYPPGWNFNIDDGVRHEGAVAGALMDKIHDVYAACYAILACFDSSTFTEKNQKLKFGLLAVADACLESNANAKELLEGLIEFVGHIEFVEEGVLPVSNEGTGSPPRSPSKK